MNEYSEETRPKFNVVEPFEGVVMVQMNTAMSKLLQDFIGEFEDLEVELQALRRALNDPRRAYDLRKMKKPSLNASRRYSSENNRPYQKHYDRPKYNPEESNEHIVR